MSEYGKSNKNASGRNKNSNKQSARERMQAERLRQRQAEARRRAFVIGGSIVGVLALGAGIAVAILTAGDPTDDKGALVIPAHASGPNGTVIVYGKADAPHTLDIWEDFRCPICSHLEKANGAAIQKLADDGTYKIQYHMATFLDTNLNGRGSRLALAATGAALNEGVDKFKKFHDVLYANQPDERDDAFGDVNHLLDLAGKVPGLKTDAFVKAVKEGTYAPWVSKVSEAFNGSGVQGTPTLKLDGQTLNIFGAEGSIITPEQFTALVQQTIAAKP